MEKNFHLHIKKTKNHIIFKLYNLLKNFKIEGGKEKFWRLDFNRAKCFRINVILSRDANLQYSCGRTAYNRQLWIVAWNCRNKACISSCTAEFASRIGRRSNEKPIIVNLDFSRPTERESLCLLAVYLSSSTVISAWYMLACTYAELTVSRISACIYINV